MAIVRSHNFAHFGTRLAIDTQLYSNIRLFLNSLINEAPVAAIDEADIDVTQIVKVKA
jgi:hypothetical protein